MPLSPGPSEYPTVKSSPDAFVISANPDGDGGSVGGGTVVFPPPPPPQDATDSSKSNRIGNRPNGRMRIFVNISFSRANTQSSLSHFFSCRQVFLSTRARDKRPIQRHWGHSCGTFATIPTDQMLFFCANCCKCNPLFLGAIECLAITADA